jgi:methylated-DNA-[protein]-cysteine S-methyltransferase
MTERTFYDVMPSPLETLLLTSDGSALTGLYLQDARYAPEVAAHWVRDRACMQGAFEQLAQYFAGEYLQFDLALAPAGTPFQRRVWRALCEIPCGATISYGEIARRIGAPSSVRAVGAAVGRNPLSLIVPCHRVVGSDGSLTGYAGGLTRKRWLLEHEARHARLRAAESSRAAS